MTDLYCRARREALHCGQCGRPYTSAIGAQECDCPPIKLRMDVLGMPAAPVVQEAVRNMSGAPAPVEDDDVPPPSGWRDRPPLL